MRMAGHFLSTLLVLACVVGTAGFAPAARVGADQQRVASRSATSIIMKDWSKRKTLAETTGGASDRGAAAVGLVGTIPVEFTQGNDTVSTMAFVGQPLSEVAAQAGQFIKYKCRKGECGTCAVRVDGEWIRTCTVKVPHVADGETYSVHVRGSMKKSKKSARFYSFRSIVAGWKNNVLGMVGFVREGRKSQANFNDRLDMEAKIIAEAKARKAARETARGS